MPTFGDASSELPTASQAPSQGGIPPYTPAASGGALDYANELIEDVLSNESCSCLKGASQHPCPRCIITIEEARKYLAICTVPAASGGALTEWLHLKLTAAQNLPYSDGDTCEECQEAVREELLPLLAAHDQKVREQAFQEAAVKVDEWLEKYRRREPDATWQACASAIRALAGENKVG